MTQAFDAAIARALPSTSARDHQRARGRDIDGIVIVDRDAIAQEAH